MGKTSTCQVLKKKLPNSVFLDGDWCWDMHPFQVTAETKGMVMQNIVFLLNNFIRCTAYDTIIFCWVMHEQAIIDEIVSRLDVTEDAVPTSLAENTPSTENTIPTEYSKPTQSTQSTQAAGPVKCQIYPISLVCSREALRARLQKDIDAKIREKDVLSRSLERLPLYESLKTRKVDVSKISPDQAAELIAGLETGPGIRVR